MEVSSDMFMLRCSQDKPSCVVLYTLELIIELVIGNTCQQQRVTTTLAQARQDEG